MTRLDQQDSYLRRFESTVTERQQQGDGTWLRLAASAFYPASGGQPSDAGTLNGIPVCAVAKRDGAVWHLLGEAPRGVPQPGERVEGVIDWPRRFRHMQRHSGQHLLSQAFVRTDPAFATHSVSLAGPVCSLDLAGDPDEPALAAAEALAAEVAYRNLPIESFEVGEGELDAYPLRRPAKVRGRVRLVTIGDWEVAACGGTHVRSTAELLPVKILRWERIKGELLRVYFSAGLEALEDYRAKHDLVLGLIRSFSAQLPDLPERIDALRNGLQEQQRLTAFWQERLVARLAAELLDAAEPLPGGRLASTQLAEGEADLLRPLADRLQQSEDLLVLLGAVQGGRAQLLFARGEGVEADMRGLLREALPAIDGRGGGRSERAQGAGTRTTGLSEALDRARTMLRGAPGGGATE